MNKLKFGLVMLILGSLSLLGAGCVQQPGNETATESAETGDEQSEVKPVPDDWLKFSHSGPSYSLRYPENWFAKLTPNPTMGDLEFLSVSTTDEEFTPTDCSFGVKSWDQEIVGDKQVAQDRAELESTVVIDGVQAEKYVFAPNEQYMAHSHFLQKDGYWYNIEFGLKKGLPEEPCLDILDTILASFEFSQ